MTYPDHGRDIDKYEYSTLNAFWVECQRASDIVASWPAWKRNLLGNSLKPTNDKPREVTR